MVGTKKPIDNLSELYVNWPDNGFPCKELFHQEFGREIYKHGLLKIIGALKKYFYSILKL